MFERFLFFLIRAIVSLRYRVRTSGLKDIARPGRRGILFLPTHPALIDPVMLLSRLFPLFRPRALADKDAIDIPVIRGVATRIGVIRIGSLTKKAGTTEAAQESIDACAEALRAGDNVIFYPAGRLLRSSQEYLGVNSGLATILAQAPDARVVLIRSRGIWGSAFSWASGYAPAVPDVLKRGFRYLLANLLFFMPRRHVTVEAVEPTDFPREAGREAINAYLETFYNATPNPNTFVPLTHFDRGGVRELPDPEIHGPSGDMAAVPPATKQLVTDFLTELTSVTNFTDTSELAADLGMDSIAYMELAGWLQDEVGSTPTDLEAFRTVGDVMLAASGQTVSAGPTRLSDIPRTWRPSPVDPHCPPNVADMTLLQAVLTQAARAPSLPIIADQTSGVRTNRQLILGARLLGQHIAQRPGDTIGIMLPASIAATATACS